MDWRGRGRYAILLTARLVLISTWTRTSAAAPFLSLFGLLSDASKTTALPFGAALASNVGVAPVFNYDDGELDVGLISSKGLRPRNIKHMIPRKMGVPLAFGWQAGFEVEFANRPRVVSYPCVYAKTCPEKETWTAEMKPFKRSAYSRPVR